jgi:hypothetical protein
MHPCQTRAPSRWPTPPNTGRAGALLLLTSWLVACGGPMLMMPGGALSGEVVTEPVTDWSFVTDTFVDLETRLSDPYSVELNYIVKDGKLYIDPAEGRTWLVYLREDPNVRVRFSGQIYPVTAVLVTSREELEGFDADRFVYRLESRTD